MTEAVERIPLTDAMTLAAFGVEVSATEFPRVMNAEHFGLDPVEAFARFNVTLEKLLGCVAAGNLTLHGRLVANDKEARSALVEPIKAHAVQSFAAFDYRINGLRHGRPQLLWFPEADEEYVQPNFARPEHYRDITVVRGHVRKYVGKGTSPYRKAAAPKPLPESELQDWWTSLTEDQRRLSQVKLCQLAQINHPDHIVTRARIRDLAGGRPPGRPKSAKK